MSKGAAKGGKRRTLAVYGRHGRSARVFLERGGELVRVQWRLNGALKTESFPNDAKGTQDARDYAQGVVESLEKRRAAPVALKVRELWAKYEQAEFPHLRPRTRTLNADAWRKWELVVGRETLAEDLGPDSLADLRAGLERQGLAVRTIGRVIAGIKTVYNWGEGQELLARNRMHRYRYKVAKDKRPTKVPEFRADEFDAIIAHLPMERRSRRWRAGGIVRICGYQGNRQIAVRHLKVTDFDLERNRIRWDARWDKLGREWWQPLRWQTREVLALVLVHHAAMDYQGPWLFPKPRGASAKDPDPVYTAQALWAALTEAERLAGVPHQRRRGAHGFRRMLARDVLAATGNLRTAAEAIGDRSTAVLEEHYLNPREDEVREAFDLLDTRKRNANRNDGTEGVA